MDSHNRVLKVLYIWGIHIVLASRWDKSLAPFHFLLMWFWSVSMSQTGFRSLTKEGLIEVLNDHFLS